MPLHTISRRSARAHLKKLVESVPEITNAILSSGGGAVAAWPLKPTLRIIGLAATTPEILELFGHTSIQIESGRFEASIVHMRRGQLLTAAVNDQLSLKVYFPPTAEVDNHLQSIRKAVHEIRTNPNL
ncbi:MAG: roadblock/LC7 domain-containing protein [Mycobacterium sp.]|nr:roadblock/LC7 domain-containing protein [Mycobacterium sp.]